jgi:hypothetical protein
VNHHPLGGFVKSRTTRTIGAALGVVIFVLFAATVAASLTNPVSAAERTDMTVTVSGR